MTITEHVTGIVIGVYTVPMEYTQYGTQEVHTEDTAAVNLDNGYRVFIPLTTLERWGIRSAPVWHPGDQFDADIYWAGGDAFLAR